MSSLRWMGVLAAGMLVAACGGPAGDDPSQVADTADVAEVGPTLVSPGIYRSHRPTAGELQYFRSLGGKTVLDLEDDMTAVSRERPMVQKLGMKFVSEPMSGFWWPDDAQVNRVLAMIADPTKQPILVHCQHGQDRTGLIIGLYRVFYENEKPAAAYKEMLSYGFHKLLVFLNHYYEYRTGWDD
jgi:hypothetical protein